MMQVQARATWSVRTGFEFAFDIVLVVDTFASYALLFLRLDLSVAFSRYQANINQAWKLIDLN
jgi:hypothetical protein